MKNDDKAPQKDTLPQPVLDAVRDLPGGEGMPELHLQTDVRSDGRFGQEWLVLTGQALFTVLQNDEGAEVRHRIPLDRIKSISAEAMVGGGVLAVEDHDGTAMHLMRFSGALTKAFDEAVGAIREFLKSGELVLDKTEVVGQVCEKCGQRLAQGTKVCPNCINKRKVLRRLLYYARPYAGKLLLMVLMLLLVTSAQMLPPYITKFIIDDILKGSDQPVDQQRLFLTGLVLILAGAHVARYLFSIFQGWLSGWIGNNLTADIRAEVFRNLQRLSLSYFDQHQTGAVMARVNQDTSHLHSFLVNVLPFTIQSALLVVSIGAVLFYINWQITVFVLLPIPLLVVIGRKVWRQLHAYYSRYFERRARLNATVGDSLWGIRVVKAFGQENHEINRFGSKNRDFRDAGVTLEQKWAMYMPIISFIAMSGTMTVWYVGGLQVIAGAMTLGSLVWYVGNMAMFYGPVQTLTTITNYLSNAMASAERVFEVLDTEPDVAEARDAVELEPMQGNIELRDVTFGYTRAKPVLEHVNLQVAAGETVGLVGRSGSGKSTITNLIARFYDPQEGSVTIDGHDVRKISKKSMGRNIGIVLQETFLFDGTIAENISYGRPDKTRVDIIEAAKAANAHDFIVGFPHGYDTRVGERGGRLSLGERQRISIARAILNDPNILILDEATSSVDTETERQIQEALDRLTENRTTLVIAHRLSTLRNADRIVVVNEGSLAEIGTHDELMAERGIYYWLVTAQKQFK